MRNKFIAGAIAVAAVVFSFAAPAFAVADTHLDLRILEAKKVLDEIMVSPDQSIPEELLAKCKAIAVYPTMLKGGFVFGARFGKGVVIAKDASGNWGPVAFSSLGGVSWGLQIGGEVTDLVLVIMNDRGLNGLLTSKVALGTDVSAAVGPIGRDAQVATDLTLTAGILTYSRSRGLFAGAVLDGTIVTTDNESNSKYYGKFVTSKEILLGNAVTVQPSSKPLVDALNEYSARWDKRIKK